MTCKHKLTSHTSYLLSKITVVALFSAITAAGGCSPLTADGNSGTSGVFTPLSQIRPFTKFRNAAELHVLRAGFTKGNTAQNILRDSKTPSQALRSLMMHQILAVEGIPRIQLKDVLQNVLSTRSSACAGVPCSRIFELKDDQIDSFLDDSLEEIKNLKTSSESEKNKELLIASLLRDESSPEGKWVVTLIPDPDSTLWTKNTATEAALSPDFPTKKGEEKGLQWTDDLRASIVWKPEYEQQFKSWKKDFDNIDDCVTRGLKKGKNYKTYNDCLADASFEEQQFISAKLVYNYVDEELSAIKGNINPRREFRAMLDKEGNVQCLVVTKKRPSLSYYTSHYKGAIPNRAIQIPALEVAYLLTAPWNLQKDHPKKIKGAGSACLGLAALESKRSPWAGRIILEGSPAAVPYYQKLGFSTIGDTLYENYYLLPAMWLEPKPSEKLIPPHILASEK